MLIACLLALRSVHRPVTQWKEKRRGRLLMQLLAKRKVLQCAERKQSPKKRLQVLQVTTDPVLQSMGGCNTPLPYEYSHTCDDGDAQSGAQVKAQLHWQPQHGYSQSNCASHSPLCTHTMCHRSHNYSHNCQLSNRSKGFILLNPIQPHSQSVNPHSHLQSPPHHHPTLLQAPNP